MKKAIYTLTLAVLITGGVSAASFNPPTAMADANNIVTSDGTMPIPICRPGYCGGTK